jgi:two-component system OmpR family sensor kinase
MMTMARAGMMTMTMTTAAATTTEDGEGRGGLRTLLRSARVRLIASMLLLLAISMIASVLALRELLLARADERVDGALDQEVREFRRLAALGRDPRTGRPFGDDARGIFEVFLDRNVPTPGEEFYTYVNGAPFRSTAAGTPPQELRGTVGKASFSDEAVNADVTAGGEELRLVAVPVRIQGQLRGVFAVTFSLTSEYDDVAEAVQTAAGVSGAVFLLGSVVAFLISGRVLAPVRELTETARAISESDLTRRIEVQGDDELAELATTFNQMLDRLEAAFTSQRQFMSDAGHELRTPITIIRGHLELMGDDPEERRETLELVTDELDRMGRMVNELLLLARAQRPDFLRIEDLSLKELRSDVLAKSEALAPRAWQAAGEGEGTVRGDRQRLTQALINLAANATHHTGDGDRIEVGAERFEGEARLWVADSGPGIRPEDQERIFDRFYRADKSRADGAGLGLAIVKAVAEAHGGNVELFSRPGKGSRFTVVLPDRPGRRTPA